MGFEDELFKITPMAININDTRALHVTELTRDALRNMGRYIAASKVALLGASYREDVGDTRYSGSEVIVRRLTEMGADVCVHDPYVEHWWEFEAQETYPAPGKGKSRFFRSQKKLESMLVIEELSEALAGTDRGNIRGASQTISQSEALRCGGSRGRAAGGHRLLRDSR